MLSRLIGETIEIAMLAGDDLPPVLADRAQLEQVIINLAINARDAMPDGGTLAIETQCATSTCGSRVSDTGTGIDAGRPGADLRAVLHDQGRRARHRARAGDRARDRHAVRRAGGRHLRSRARLDLHRVLPAARTSRARSAVEHREQPALGGDETLLLCEDEDGVRPLVELVLTGAGYTRARRRATRGRAAIAAREGDAIDALVTDIVMPGMSGLELADRLAPLRTLFISGYSAEVAGAAALPPGSAFLEKPFDHGTLLAEVRELLDARAHRVRAMIDERTDLGALVARHLREDRVVWLTTVTPGGARSRARSGSGGTARTPCYVFSLPDTAAHRATSPPTARSR